MEDNYSLAGAIEREKSVDIQMSKGTYDFASNKALLKYYQMSLVSNDSAKTDIISDILVLALMRLPSTDFLSLSYLVPGKLATVSPKIKLIQKCADHLERAQYKEFWAEYLIAPHAVFSGAIGFEQTIRQIILNNIGETFRNISKAQLCPMLGFESSSLSSFLTGCPLVESSEGDNITFIPSEETSKASDSTNFDEVLRLVETIRAVV